MNVTIKIDDALCREARHRAVDRGLSLSGWIAEIVSRELGAERTGQGSLLDALAVERGAEKVFEAPRDRSEPRDPSFS